ncbi:MAG: HAMP domain-containing histidine kinase [Planctomycetes bacterium]|nr:HAMP domain-containing histidine kinase [Planctomycetota bacterium]
MSYRTIKRLLGETSLERKCRFLFGAGLLLLITGSFYFYGRLNTRLVYEQNTTTARMLVEPILAERHWTHYKRTQDPEGRIEDFAEAFRDYQPPRALEYRARLVKADFDPSAPGEQPEDDAGHDALEQLRRGRDEVAYADYAGGHYYYYGAVRAAESCLKCHAARNPGVHAEGDLIGMIKIAFPLETTENALAWNNAILLATAIVTAFVAMLGAYAIVRYVIVKPVLHLKDVSDEIARGTLDLRADIRTGDEFEELSHAFNRMLRHLTTVQEELREVNADLDGKVDQLARVNLQLYEMNKLKDEFLATMSHELRTPLNSILGFSDVLSRAANLTDKQKRFVSNIQASGRDLMALINDLLDLAKIESGKMELQPVEFSPHDLIERQAASMQPMAERKNIELTWHVERGLETVEQDPTKLQQILNNLLSNAIKFTPEGGRVRIGASRVGDDWFELIVEDTGIGIPLEDQDAIFDKFRQGRSIPGQKDAMTREYGGTGLGLSIVKELAKLLGGEVLLDSEFGKGSTFTVRLPVRLDVEAVGPLLPETVEWDEDSRQPRRETADDLGGGNSAAAATGGETSRDETAA